MQRKLDDLKDVFEDETGDEETAKGGKEENEIAEGKALGGVVAVSLAELVAERDQVQALLDLAKQVDAKGDESKFDKLREVLDDPESRDEKLIIFTEHRDTLDYLVRRLEGLGFTGQIARIHGGMDFREREEQIEFFRKKIRDGGALYMVCTDAAGEGLNMQFAWRLLNWDIPWNPARLEQRMGRIHRYKQMHDPVFIINLVAGKTREGRVMKTLLEKLERIRKELGSDKVFDVIGRLFEGLSIKDYMERAVTTEGAEAACRALEGTLTKEQVEALEAKERRLYGDGGDVKASLAAERAKLDREGWRRLLPGYVRRFIEKSAPLLGLGIEGDLDADVRLHAAQARRARLPLEPAGDLPAVATATADRPQAEGCRRGPVPPSGRAGLRSVAGPRLRAVRRGRSPGRRLRGPVGERAVPVPPGDCLGLAEGRPVAPDSGAGRSPGTTARRASPVRGRVRRAMPGRAPAAAEGGSRHSRRPQPRSRRRRASWRGRRGLTPRRRSPGRWPRIGVASGWRACRPRLDFVSRGFEYQDSELAQARGKLREKAQAGDPRAKGELTRIKDRQKALAARREAALAVLHREPELIGADEVAFLAHALVVPTDDPEEQRRFDAEVEAIAVKVAWAFEEAAGAVVQDVSKPHLARAAGWRTIPASTCSRIAQERVERGIEVKGRAGIGDVELTENEWAKSCTQRDRYWLYVVFDCGTPHPRLLRVRDPFGKLVVKAKGSVRIDGSAHLRCRREGLSDEHRRDARDRQHPGPDQDLARPVAGRPGAADPRIGRGNACRRAVTASFGRGPTRGVPVERVLGMLKTDREPPTDEECRRIVEEERWKKYGS